MSESESTPPERTATRWQDRTLGLRGVVAVGLTTLVLGGLGGAAIATIAHHDGHRDGWSRLERDGRDGPGRGPRGFAPQAPPSVVPPTTQPEDDTQPDAPTTTPSSGTGS